MVCNKGLFVDTHYSHVYGPDPVEYNNAAICLDTFFHA